MQTVLVTGGAGFIGSHLVNELINKHYSVIVIDNLSQGKIEWVNKDATFFNIDITNYDELVEKCGKLNIEGIFHLAAMSRVASSIDKVDFCTDQNVRGTLNILKFAKQFNIKKVIYSGSSTYYGKNDIPHVEDLNHDFLNPYALTKYVGELYCDLYSKLFNVSTIILRYFNVYGPRQPSTGAYALVLGIFLDRFKNNLPLEIHGDGKQRRDFIHVTDVVRANIMALNSDIYHDTYNVGSGTNISVIELANMISNNYYHTDFRKGDAKDTLADISKIKKDMNWEPLISFNDGLKQLIEVNK